MCEFGGDDCVKTPSLVDRTAQKYTQPLVDRVEYMYNKLKDSCKLLNLPPAPTRAPPTRKKVLKILNSQSVEDKPATKTNKVYSNHIDAKIYQIKVI